MTASNLGRRGIHDGWRARLTGGNRAPGRDRARGHERRRRSLRTPNALWSVPAAGAAVAGAAALLLGHRKPWAGGGGQEWAWPGGSDAGIAFLQVVAGSVITVTSLTFTLIVVALQLASQQFSPRLLREFSRDPVVQGVLAVLVGTFVAAVTVLRGLNPDEPLPRLALLFVFVMALASVGALIVFLGHITSVVRVDTMMAAVHAETSRAIERTYLRRDPEEGPVPERPDHPGELVAASRSGFVQRIDLDHLQRMAEQSGVLILILVRVGDQVSLGSPVAEVVPPGQASTDLTHSLHTGIRLGHERTLEGDPGLGIRQLTDIGVKALSPGINDPATATHALGHLSDLLIRLLNRRLGPRLVRDVNGEPRLYVPDRDLRYYLDGILGPIRRYGRAEPLVALAILRLLRDLAVSALDEHQRAEIRRQVELLRSGVAPMDAADGALVEDAARRVHLALEGALREAYIDRAGETRST